MIQLQHLHLVLTYRCTNRCAHCRYRAGPDRRETMTAAEVTDHLAAASDCPPAEITLSGGEPFLFPDLLHVAVVQALQLAPTRVSTNSFWATDLPAARRQLAPLHAAGLRHLQLSVDSFHQPDVPLDRLATAIQAARELDEMAIEIASCALGDSGGHALDRRTQEVIDRLTEISDLAGITITRTPVQMIGRAADRLSAFLPTRTAPPTHCPLSTHLGGDLDLSLIHI